MIFNEEKSKCKRFDVDANMGKAQSKLRNTSKEEPKKNKRVRILYE